jgi:hypothetical protein
MSYQCLRRIVVLVGMLHYMSAPLLYDLSIMLNPSEYATCHAPFIVGSVFYSYTPFIVGPVFYSYTPLL